MNKDLQDKINKIYEEHPEIQINPYRFVYTGSREYILDCNLNYDPTDDWDSAIDGIEAGFEEDNSWEKEISLGEKMMQNLCQKDAELIKLYFEDGWSFAKIGRKWGCTRQNVKYHYHRIINKLQKEYQEDWDGI